VPQSLSKVIIHFIFSTKDRHPWLGVDIRPRVHALRPSAATWAQKFFVWVAWPIMCMW
jgi:hypothetical protein